MFVISFRLKLVVNKYSHCAVSFQQKFFQFVHKTESLDSTFPIAYQLRRKIYTSWNKKILRPILNQIPKQTPLTSSESISEILIFQLFRVRRDSSTQSSNLQYPDHSSTIYKSSRLVLAINFHPESSRDQFLSNLNRWEQFWTGVTWLKWDTSRRELVDGELTYVHVNYGERPYNHRNADGGTKGVAAAAATMQPGDREITRCYYIVLRAL